MPARSSAARRGSNACPTAATANQRPNASGLRSGCGKEDFLWNFHGQLKAFLEGKGVKATIVETPGAHTWMVWRRYLSEFAPQLFQPRS